MKQDSRNLAQPSPLVVAASLAPGVILFTAFFVVPIGMVLSTSLTDWSARSLDFVGFENFDEILSDERFWRAALNTLFYVTAALLVQVPLATVVALVLSRRVRGWKFMRTLLFLPNMMSGAALGLVYIFVFNPRYGLLNGLLRAIGWDDLTRDWLYDLDSAIWAVTSTWVFSIGLYVILIMTDILSLPPEIHEAAELDGASVTRRELLITLPLIRPVLGTCALLALLFTLSYFDGVYVMTGGGPADRTATLALYGYRAYTAGNWGEANAVGSLILILGVALIVLVRWLGRLEVSDR